MTRSSSKSARRSRFAVAGGSLIAVAALVAMLTLAGSSAASSPTTVGLGTADPFAVLAYSGVTDNPTSTISGNVGVTPTTGANISGLTCPEVTGTIYTVDAAGPACRVADPGLLTTAASDRDTAYTDAQGRTPDSNPGPALGGQTLTPGVYVVDHDPTANVTGTLTLNGSAASVWIFQASSDLVFANASRVVLTGGAQACHVFWQVSTTATLGTTSSIVGTIIAYDSIVIQHGASLSGRALAQTGDVTLDDNSIQRPTCASSGGSSAPAPPPPSQPDRAIYCAPDGRAYDLVKGQDKDPPYAALNLVPAYIDPVTGSASCSFPAAATTTTAVTTTTPATTTTTTTTTVPPPTPVTPAPTPKPAPPARKTKGVKAAKHTAVHVAPKPAKNAGGFTG